MITLKINVKLLDKTKFFHGKNGAIYADLVLFETPGDQYGNDYRVVQSVTKEDRAAGVKGAIVGNGKVFGQSPVAKPTPSQTSKPVEQDDVPF